MSWAATIYVDEDGSVYGASNTDQRGCHNKDNRTVNSRPVERVGIWWGSQMNYAPYKRACAAAQARAYMRTPPLSRLSAVG